MNYKAELKKILNKALDEALVLGHKHGVLKGSGLAAASLPKEQVVAGYTADEIKEIIDYVKRNGVKVTAQVYGISSEVVEKFLKANKTKTKKIWSVDDIAVVLDYASKHGNAKAAGAYRCSVQSIAAWKAHQTRGTYRKR